MDSPLGREWVESVRFPLRPGANGSRYTWTTMDEEPELTVAPPEDAAAGPASVWSAARHALRAMGPLRTARTLARVNQADGFDCPGCAWPEGDHRHHAELCENGVKAIAEEATRERVDRAFFARYAVAALT